MRYGGLLLCIVTVFHSGCASELAGAGKDLGALTSLEEMRDGLAEYGASGVAEGKRYEEFRTRKVIAQNQDGHEGYIIAWASTFGTIDLIAVPYQVYLIGKRSVVGQTVRVTYDEDGSIGEVERDGVSVLSMFRQARRSEEQKAREQQNAALTITSPTGRSIP